jgi:putative heme-binding domain-containing protein
VQLLESTETGIRERAEKLLAAHGIRKDRAVVLERYTAALSLARDAKRGQEVFDKQCAKCHQIRDRGYVVGPDLTATTRRTDEMLLADMFDPSSQITVGFNNYTVITEDGRIFTGVLTAETATSVTLRREEAAEDTLLRKDIDEMLASPVSMMPENLEAEVTPQNAVDVIAYLRSSFGAPLTRITLFEDQHEFVAALTDGGGKARLESDGPFSGTDSLVVTPLQRHSARMPGWEYPIRQEPGPGEFRYLRFAWRSRQGQGLMLELADGGRWPPAEEPLRRYYSGENHTGWAAVQVSPQPPREWTVVTRDLWKDFGDFTLTGIAPTAIGDEAMFDRIELLRSVD